jgi:hypothetical protein
MRAVLNGADDLLGRTLGRLRRPKLRPRATNTAARANRENPLTKLPQVTK